MMYEKNATESCSYTLYKHRCVNTSSSIMFSIWKKLILDILLEPAEWDSNIESLSDTGVIYYTDKKGNISTINTNNVIVQHLIQNNYGNYLSLLNNAIFEASVFEVKEQTVDKLSGNEIEDIKIDLVFVIIQFYIKIKAKKFIFLM